MIQIFSNSAEGNLATSLAISGTSIQVTNASTTFPTIQSGQYLVCTIKQNSVIEIVKVLSRTGDILIVERAQEGTTAQSFSTGAYIKAEVTAGSLSSMIQQTQQAGYLKEEIFRSSYGQSVFNLTSGKYTPGQSTLVVIINGVTQASNTYTELSESSFYLKYPLFKYETVIVRYYNSNFTNYSTTYTITHVVDGNARVSLGSYLKSLEDRIRELEAKVV